MEHDADDQRRVFEYFIVAGLPDSPSSENEIISNSSDNEVQTQMQQDSVAPITDICIIFTGLGETVPKDYECIQTTPQGYPANLNHGSIRAPAAFLCYKRGHHKPPLIDIGLLDESKGERPMLDATIIERTPFGRSANVNNTSNGIYFTTRRAEPSGPPHQLVVTHLCVILENKEETPPFSYYKIDKNLNKGMLGSDVFVCYKKSQSCCKRIAYKPTVLDCFPRLQNITESIAKNVPMFCLPMGALIESWPQSCKPAETQFSTCVLTDEAGTKFYGASLTFYEDHKELTSEQKEKLELSINNDDNLSKDVAQLKVTYHRNKAICLVSRYPFFESFRKFLYFIYGISISGPQKIPIERYISHMMYEVPFPSFCRPRVLVELGHDTISFENHDDSQIPLSGATFFETLRCLGTDNLLTAMFLALLEQKILVHSLRPWLLTYVAETICALMFPFSWQCPYIPQCPLPLAGVLHAPLPFIVGVDSRYFDLYDEPPPDVTCFDLDTMSISKSEILKILKISLLPKKPLKKLRSTLREIQDDILKADIERQRKERRQFNTLRMNWELAIREAFLRFMCSLMSGYTKFLRPIKKPPDRPNATETRTLFDIASFLRTRDKNSTQFYERFCATQCFNRFIEERSFVSEKNSNFIFFDDCIRKHYTENGPQFLDRDSLSLNRTIVIPPPRLLSNLQDRDGQFVYNRFPEKFVPEFFELKWIKKANDEVVDPFPYQISLKSSRFSNVSVRTKQEIRNSLSETQNLATGDDYSWPQLILFYSYSLWFTQLPSMLAIARNKSKIIKLAIKVLNRMERSGVRFYDQVCYRIVIHLCGQYNRPDLAVHVFNKMLCACGTRPNALTYGIYHNALITAMWPPKARLVALDAWRRLRMRIEVCTLFRIHSGIEEFECSYLPNQNQVSSTNELAANNSGLDSSSISRLQDHECDHSDANSLGMSSISKLAEASESSTYSEDVQFTKPTHKKSLDEELHNRLDPLGATKSTEENSLTSSTVPNPAYLTPSREKFMLDHSSSPFSNEFNDRNESSKRKKPLRFTSALFKNFSPLLDAFRQTDTPRSTLKASSVSTNKNDSLRSGMSNVSASPSISSLVRHVAIKGYDEVLNQSNDLLRRSGINSLVEEARGFSLGLNKSFTSVGDATISSWNDLETYEAGPSHKIFTTQLFQLDSGFSGDLLSAQFWMKELLPETINEIKEHWIHLKNLENTPKFLDIALCSCTQCPACNCIAYDEEIISGWTNDDANLNTRCPSCNTNFIASLKIKIREKHSETSVPSWYMPLVINIVGEEMSTRSDEHEVSQDIVLPYLNPLVLRRELEMLLLPDPLLLTRPSMRAAHPIIFWNLLYYCKRLDLPTHILTWVSPVVHIRCVHDVPSAHKQNELPIYLANHVQKEIHQGTRIPPYIEQPQMDNLSLNRIQRLYSQIIEHLEKNELSFIIKLMIAEHREAVESQAGQMRSHFSIYRDILFVALDRFSKNVDREQFDSRYQQEIEHLPVPMKSRLSSQDFLPKSRTIACRRIFLPMDVL